VLGARRCLGPGLRRGDDVKRLVILISGRGSNMAALIDAVRAGEIDAAIGTVISNRPDAAGLGIAAAAGVATSVVDHRAFADRGEFERSLIAAIDAKAPDLVVLAGFMRILSPAFVTRYAGRLLNIHPSLLPAFRGLHTHAQALAAGVRVHGCTVHLVRFELDEGPVLAQGVVPVLDGDTEESLAARVLEVEHRCYPQALALFASGRARVEGERLLVAEEAAGERLVLHPLLQVPHAEP